MTRVKTKKELVSVELNRSERIWLKVRALMPNYKEKHKWLRENWHMLNT